ncbi:MAG: AzlD domain-containing protein [Lachnospiraceae bacterium]|jgi:branched-subunit amino acid transport protein AzlD|nr:AzlD domain-containing protein [Lachnospiraceae bacterium]
MIDVTHSLAIIAVVAVCTLALRAAPFVVFGRHKTVPPWIHYLGEHLPAAVMATLVFYCLRGINLFTGNHGIPELAATALAVALHSWKKNILLTVAVSTIFYMIIVQNVI